MGILYAPAHLQPAFENKCQMVDVLGIDRATKNRCFGCYNVKKRNATTVYSLNSTFSWWQIPKNLFITSVQGFQILYFQKNVTIYQVLIEWVGRTGKYLAR